MTQESLAERAGLSVGVVKKIERGGTARLETYHALARVLRVHTSALFEPAAPHATRRTDPVGERVSLLPLRQAIAPPLGLSGNPAVETVEDEPDLRLLRETARSLDHAYHRNEYGRVSELLPHLIISARAAVDALSGTAREVEALKLRSDAFQQAGRYLTQLRTYDLAHLALRDALADAHRAGDRLAAGAAVYLQGWVLMRQGRLDEAERVATAAAEALEPRISHASRDELAVWGRLLVKASSAAARNNRPAESRELLKLARTAGVMIGDTAGGSTYKSGAFSLSSVAFQAIENWGVVDRPDRVLALSGRISASRASTSNTMNRHLLDVVHAHTKMRQTDEATGILWSLTEKAPDWVRQQQLAVDAVEDVLHTKRRRLTKQQRALAAFFDVT
jgi:transcriptional regulator with XRE-family HTH domain